MGHLHGALKVHGAPTVGSQLQQASHIGFKPIRRLWRAWPKLLRHRVD
eukprot:CAMPEP_0114655268 /NCGR_PEP_ID=MMETSP0191-20121206/11001_1 /TAXON_ID=126664 /ORGANISM="Sorites sp." /LENGTH=47 /DNA_ID= /DNA_START= /DNA_END= /DNA_ORIENTATION=